MADTNKRTFREAFLLNISKNPHMAIESAKGSFSSLKEVAGSPAIAHEYAAKIMTLFCSQFSRWGKKGPHRTHDDPRKDKFLSECLLGVSALLDGLRLGKKPISIVASAWPSITAWTMHIYEDIYPLENPEKQAAWRKTLLHACDIAWWADLETSKLHHMIVKLWIEVEDATISHALWICCAKSRNVPHPTQYLGELGLSPDEAAELAVDRLFRTYEECMRNPRPTMWEDVVTLIYGCSALSISPDPSFGAAMLRKNAFSLTIRIIRNYRLHNSSPTQRRMRCAFRIHALHAFFYGIVIRLDPDDCGIRSLSQALRKGLIEVMVTALLSISGLGENEREAAGSVRQNLFHVFPRLFAHKPVVSAAGKGMSYFKHDLVHKLSASDLQPEWSKFEQLLLERFILYRMNCYLRRTEEYTCSNVKCGVVRSGAQMLKCANCKTTLYCSRACQKEDWHENDHRLSCVKEKSTRWNKRYLQTIASNAVIRYLPGIQELAAKKGVSPRHLAFIVMFTPSGLNVGIKDLRDKRNWKAGFEYYFEDALDEAEDKPMHPHIMVIEVLYQSDDLGTSFTHHFIFSERFPTHESSSRIDNGLRESGNARSSSGEVMKSCYNQLDSVVDSVRETMQVEGQRLNLGFWSEHVVDNCIRSVDEKYGSARDIIGHPVYHINTFGEEFLN